jgi:Cytosine/adenosine deaminases
MSNLDSEYMELAYTEACKSLQEGNHGFGAVIVDNDQVISSSHDTEKTEADATLHAEITAISKASKKLGHDLSSCTIYSTHEPCPMCATALYWSGIKRIFYSFPIDEALSENRKRIDIRCVEIFQRANCDVEIVEKVLYEKCKHLYHDDVRKEIKLLRNKTKEELSTQGELIKAKRIIWMRDHRKEIPGKDSLEKGYNGLLAKLGIDGKLAPIIRSDESRIVFHSMNYCPTLEACKILGYDTRLICKYLLEEATNCFIKELDPRIRFTRNYDQMRPYSEYCEEIIEIENG